MNSKTKEDVKSEIIRILTPIFGDDVKNIIMSYYDNPSEMVKLTDDMLSNYMGEKNAKKILNDLFKKFPRLRKEAG